MAGTVSQKKQIAFWKKHQTLLQACAELSSKSDARVLVIFFWPIDPVARSDPWRQCIVNIPNKYTRSNNFKQTIEVGDSVGDISAVNLSGSTVVFDSFSSEADVRARNPVVNSVSNCNDSARCGIVVSEANMSLTGKKNRHFTTDFNVQFSGKVAAVLCPSTVASYRIVGPRSESLLPADKRPPHVKAAEERKRARETMEEDERRRHVVARRTYPVTEDSAMQTLQQEIERQRQRTAMILDDSVPISVLRSEFTEVPSHHQIPICARPPAPIAPMRYSSLSEAVAALRHTGGIAPSFASALLSKRPTPASSSETLVCTTPARDLMSLPPESPRASSDEVLISGLHRPY
jgi:hypothetical protein